MGSHKHIGASRSYPPKPIIAPPIPPPPTADFVAYYTGSPPDPDPSGNFFDDGIFNGKESYRNIDSSWFIFYSLMEGAWLIALTKIDEPDDYYSGGSTTPVGDYIAPGGYSGTPKVRVGP